VALNDATGIPAFGELEFSSAIANMIDCDMNSLQFGDLNGDGRDDALCLAPDGTLSAYMNSEAASNPGNTTWTGLGVIMSAQGYSRDMVRLADIDGDGRLDYIGLDAAGNARAWRNVGTQQTLTPSWLDMGIVNSGGTMGDVDGIRFVCWLVFFFLFLF
jgi:hypothetical protein